MHRVSILDRGGIYWNRSLSPQVHKAIGLRGGAEKVMPYFLISVPLHALFLLPRMLSSPFLLK